MRNRASNLRAILMWRAFNSLSDWSYYRLGTIILVPPPLPVSKITYSLCVALVYIITRLWEFILLYITCTHQHCLSYILSADMQYGFAKGYRANPLASNATHPLKAELEYGITNRSSNEITVQDIIQQSELNLWCASTTCMWILTLYIWVYPS